MADRAERREIETGFQDLRCHIQQRVAVVTLNRPESRNALSVDLKESLLDLLPRLGSDPEVGCLLLTGAGRAFCSGGDTRKMSTDGRVPSPAERLRALHREHRIPLLLHRLEKPTLAALPGPAAGAGFSLALACDLRIAAQSAFVTTSYARLGLSGDYGGSWFLTRLVGPARAKEIYFSGDRLSAGDCERLGIVNRVVPDAELPEAAFAWARRLAEGPPIALGLMKDNLNRAIGKDLESCLELEAERMVASAQTEDYLEAVEAFAEKRKPVFRGR